MTNDQDLNNGPKVVQTDNGKKDGQNKCPRCGATDISLNEKTGLLRCNFCRHEFKPDQFEAMEKDISKLQGDIFGSGTQDIQEDSEQNILTLKCQSCGAEVVIDTAEATQARCHWCRNTLSVNQQVPNGAVPDMVLPFKLTKAEAKQKIEEFVGKRKFFAHPTFVQEFTTENVMGVYCPYMVVDVNGHASYAGQAEHEIRHYPVKVNDHTETRYDAELYDIEREFDITVDGLTVESNSDKLDTKAANKTNNIINSIMPFDTENCVKWNPNFLKGYTSEKRDVNVDQLRPLVEAQAGDVARFAATHETMEYYNRGANFREDNLSIKGTQWRSAYLPIWLYSYQQKKSNNEDSILHYVAVNARTQETMGSVPVHMPKLALVSALVGLAGGGLYSLFSRNGFSIIASLVVGLIYFAILYSKYRNTGARHTHEKETKHEITNVRKVDNFVKKEHGLSNSSISGKNSDRVNGANGGSNVTKFINGAIEGSSVNKFVSGTINKMIK